MLVIWESVGMQSRVVSEIALKGPVATYSFKVDGSTVPPGSCWTLDVAVEVLAAQERVLRQEKRGDSVKMVWISGHVASRELVSTAAVVLGCPGVEMSSAERQMLDVILQRTDETTWFWNVHFP